MDSKQNTSTLHNTLDELTIITNFVNNESIDQRIIDFVSYYTLSKQRIKCPNIKFQNTIIGFNAKKLNKHDVYIILEQHTTHKFGVIYKGDKTIFYKNVHGTDPSKQLKQILKQANPCILRVNKIYDGYTKNVHLLAIQNSFCISKIAQSNSENYENSFEFAKSEDVYAFKEEIFDFLLNKMSQHIKIEILHKAMYLSQPQDCIGRKCLMNEDEQIKDIALPTLSSIDEDYISLNQNIRAVVAISQFFSSSQICKVLNIDTNVLETIKESDFAPQPVQYLKVLPANLNLSLGHYLEAFYAINDIIPNLHGLEQIKNRMKELLKDKEKHMQYFKDWAQEQKSTKMDISKPDNLELIAYCVRTMELIKDIEFRDVQLMAILLALEGDRHVFLEIKTGEGKTVIIAVVAAVKVLIGQHVHIITSNELLAETNSMEMKQFYETLAISCSFLQLEHSKLDYDIVYGSIWQFQVDYLNNCLKNAKAGRSYECCILDEVDLLIDNSMQLAKIAEPFPGMEMLQVIYECLVKDEQIGNLDQFYIPDYLKPHCELMWDKWIDNLSKSKDKYIKNVHYLIKNKIIPIDYKYTGSILTNTVFTDGIQQFLELLHLKHLINNESLNSVFISNFGFIRLYENRIFGVSGTLGSKEERDIFNQMFNKSSRKEQECSFYKIPSYRLSLFEEENMILTYGWEWDMIQHVVKSLSNITDMKIVFFTNDDLCARLQLVVDLRYTDFASQIKFCSQFNELNKECEEGDHIQVCIPLIENGFYLRKPTNNVEENYQAINCVDENSVIWKDLKDASCIIVDYTAANDIYNLKKTLAICKVGYLFEPVYKDDLFAQIARTVEDYKYNYNVIIYDEFNLLPNADQFPNLVKNDKEIHLELNKMQEGSFKIIVLINRSLVDCRLTDNCQLQTLFWDNICSFGVNSILINAKYKQFESISKKNKIWSYPVTGFSKAHFQHCQTIRDVASRVCRQNRSVLLICENIAQVNEFQKYFRNLSNIIKYTGNESKSEVDSLNFKETLQIDVNQIVLTTNMGGRGVDFKITQKLEKSGGLHVILSFLPINERVEDQAFGRTARNGVRGTGQIIINANSLKSILIKDLLWQSELSMERIKAFRNAEYLSKLEDLKSKKLEQICFNDDICNYYIKFYKHLKQEEENSSNKDLSFIIKDVTECWAFWLKHENSKNTLDGDARKSFQMFRQHAKDVISGNKYFNPVYFIERAVYNFHQNNYPLVIHLIECTLNENYLSESAISEYFHFIGLALWKPELLHIMQSMLMKVKQCQQQFNIFKKNKNISYGNWNEIIKIFNDVVFHPQISNRNSIIMYNENNQTTLEEYIKKCTRFKKLPNNRGLCFEILYDSAILLQSNDEETIDIVKQQFKTLLKTKGMKFLWKFTKKISSEFMQRAMVDFFGTLLPGGNILAPILSNMCKIVIKKSEEFVKQKYMSGNNKINSNVKSAIASYNLHEFTQQITVILEKLLNQSESNNIENSEISMPNEKLAYDKMYFRENSNTEELKKHHDEFISTITNLCQSDNNRIEGIECITERLTKSQIALIVETYLVELIANSRKEAVLDAMQEESTNLDTNVIRN